MTVELITSTHATGSRLSMTCYPMDQQHLCSVAVAIAFGDDGNYPRKIDASKADESSWM